LVPEIQINQSTKGNEAKSKMKHPSDMAQLSLVWIKTFQIKPGLQFLLDLSAALDRVDQSVLYSS